MTETTKADATKKARAFTFGEPEPVLDARQLMGMAETWWNGRYYEPPYDFCGLAKIESASPHHESAMRVKVNRVVRDFVPTRYLSRQDFRLLVKNYILLGNSAFEWSVNRLGEPMRLKPLLTRWARIGKNGSLFYLVDGQEIEIKTRWGWIKEADVSQTVYGRPSYMAAILAILLNESATLFRRRYYVNGSHAGYIMYLTDPTQSPEDIDALEEAMLTAKGPGNFKNLFVYAPGGDKDGLKIIPVSQINSEDNFLKINDASAGNIMVAHRVPPQLMGILPPSGSNFGDGLKADILFQGNEIAPLQGDLLEINDIIGVEAVKFADPPPLAA